MTAQGYTIKSTAYDTMRKILGGYKEDAYIFDPLRIMLQKGAFKTGLPGNISSYYNAAMDIILRNDFQLVILACTKNAEQALEMLKDPEFAFRSEKPYNMLPQPTVNLISHDVERDAERRRKIRGLSADSVKATPKSAKKLLKGASTGKPSTTSKSGSKSGTKSTAAGKSGSKSLVKPTATKPASTPKPSAATPKPNSSTSKQKASDTTKTSSQARVPARMDPATAAGAKVTPPKKGSSKIAPSGAASTSRSARKRVRDSEAEASPSPTEFDDPPVDAEGNTDMNADEEAATPSQSPVVPNQQPSKKLRAAPAAGDSKSTFSESVLTQVLADQRRINEQQAQLLSALLKKVEALTANQTAGAATPPQPDFDLSSSSATAHHRSPAAAANATPLHASGITPPRYAHSQYSTLSSSSNPQLAVQNAVTQVHVTEINRHLAALQAYSTNQTINANTVPMQPMCMHAGCNGCTHHWSDTSHDNRDAGEMSSSLTFRTAVVVFAR